MSKLNRLTLKNFKRHAFIEVEFDNGMNGIVGPNYSGKSTILWGVCFALGGIRQVPWTRIHRVGAESEPLLVSLEFTVGSDTYLVERTKSSDNLSRNGEKIATGKTQVNATISEILGMPVARFLDLKYAKQKKASQLLEQGSSYLFKIVSELVGADQVTAAIQELSRKTSVAEGKLSAYNMDDIATLEDKKVELARLKFKLDMEQEAYAGVAESKAKAAADHAKAVKELDHATVIFEARQRHAQRLQDARNRVSKAQLQLDAAKARQDELRQSPTYITSATVEGAKEGVAKALELRSVVLGADTNNHNIMRGVSAAREKLEAATNKLNSAKTALDGAAGLKDLIAEASKSRDEIAGRMPEVEAKQHELRHQISRLGAALEGGVCPECQRPYEGGMSESEIKAEQLKLDQAQEQLSAVTRTIATKTAELKTLKDKIELWTSNLTKLGWDVDSAEAEFDKAESEANAAIATLSGITELPCTMAEAEEGVKNALSFCDRLEQQERAELNCTNAITVASNALEGANSTLQDIEQASEFEDSPTTDLAELSRAVREAQAAMLQANANESMARDKLDQVQKDVAGLSPVVLRLEKDKEDAEAASLVWQNYKALLKYIRDNQDRYVHGIWDVLMASASMFVSAATGGRISRVLRSEDGDFQYEEDGKIMQASEGSGAQTSIIGLAIQMALADAAPCALDIQLMDEPGADCDPEHAAALMTVLAASSRQVIAITHRELDTAIFNNTITLGEGE